jgi:hypothetical protein
LYCNKIFWLLLLELWKTSPILTSDSLHSENFTIGLAKIKGLMCVLLRASAQCSMGLQKKQPS